MRPSLSWGLALTTLILSAGAAPAQQKDKAATVYPLALFVFDELALNISGVVKADEAAKVGQLTGAKLIVTGSVSQVDKSIYLVAKVIGTETTRVSAASASGKASDELAPLVEKLADSLADTI